VKLALANWFAACGWKANKFQRDVWAAIAQDQSGLLHATTGSGKTYAVWLGILMHLMPLAASKRVPLAAEKITKKKPVAAPLTVLWITPMRALAADTQRALQLPLDALMANMLVNPYCPFWTVGVRSGDTPAAERSAQNTRLPTVLVTTPESLSVLLSRADAAETLGSVQAVVVDEWHELMGNKRGVQTQLALARLKTFKPAVVIWAMSATLGNLQEAMHTLLGRHNGMLVQGAAPKKLTIDTLLPDVLQRFPWAGHLGLSMLPKVVSEIDASATCLVFTNTRSQSELWYQAILQARPDWAGLIALHHGSLDRGVREWVEAGLKNGELRAVVCTSSLDLGVDFLPVERVLQIGSAKGVARLLQRAGRSGHAPGRPSRITLVPTHSLEIIEAVASRCAVASGQIETRASPQQPLDVLVQHLVTVALGGGFLPQALLQEVRSTAAYANLSDEAWAWCLAFVSQGGVSLAAYPDYQRAGPDAAGIWRVTNAQLARRHRMNIGTIVSDASITVQYLGGAKIGSVEESFAARLKPGDCFSFGGRLLELVRVHDMTAWVRKASGKRAAVPRWSGGRMPLSTTLATSMLAQLAFAASGRYDSPELKRVRPLLELQRQWSALPTPTTLLAELHTSRDGTHLFLYPFAGRNVHLGLASVFAWRAAQITPRTFSIAVNDYGFELLCSEAVDWSNLLPELLSSEHDAVLLDEVLASLNASELTQRRFREIARVSGLVFQGYPGEKRSNKQLQASSSLFYEVFRKYDAANLLLAQARTELLAEELEISRLQHSLAEMARHVAAQQFVIKLIARPTPFSFPLMVERLREKLSNESVADRIARMVQQLEKAAGGAAPAADLPGLAAIGQALALGKDTLVSAVKISANSSAQREPPSRRRIK
jgi:ATP-dependent Lhr-like helicase